MTTTLTPASAAGSTPVLPSPEASSSPDAASSPEAPSSPDASSTPGESSSRDAASTPEAGALDARTPLTSRADLDRRVRQLIPCATQRQLWLLMLDADDVQMPVMIPIGDLPLHDGAPAPDGEGVVELLVTMAKEFDVAAFVFVLEREGPRTLAADDVAWLTYLLQVGTGHGLRVRGVYLCHDDGVSGYEADDLDELSRRRHHAVSASSFDM